MKPSCLHYGAVGSALLMVTACTSSPSAETKVANVGTENNELRDARRSEAKADFEQIISAFDAWYAPMARKTREYGFSFDDEAAKTLDALRSNQDSNTFRTIHRFLDHFHDGHISYSASMLSDSSREIAIPLLVTPVEGHYLAYATGSSLAGQIARGDELTAIDGASPHDFARIFMTMDGFPSAKTAIQIAAYYMTQRPFFLPASLLPAPGTLAHLELTRADGSRYSVQTPWISIRPPPRLSSRKTAAVTHPGAVHPMVLANDTLQEVALAQSGFSTEGYMGRSSPVFLTPQVRQTFAIQPVRPSDATLAALQVTPCEGASSPSYDCYQSFVGLYSFQGKRVLLVRIPSYVTSATPGNANSAGYIKAALHDFQAMADVLVIDETNNPGGDPFFADDVFRALIMQPATPIGFAFHADRRSVNQFRQYAEEASALGPDSAVAVARPPLPPNRTGGFPAYGSPGTLWFGRENDEPVGSNLGKVLLVE